MYLSKFAEEIAPNIVASFIMFIGVFVWFYIMRRSAFKKWANKSIIPLWVYYLTLDNRFSRLQRTIQEASGLKSKVVVDRAISAREEWPSGLGALAPDKLISLALDLSKAEADSTCLSSYVAIWVRHANAIGLPHNIAESVWKLEEAVTEFNTSLIRHTSLLQSLLQLNASGSMDEEFIAKQRNGYMRYFLGGVDRVVSTIDKQEDGRADFSKVGGRSLWTLNERLCKIKEAIQSVHETCGDKKITLHEGETLWSDEKNKFYSFCPMIPANEPAPAPLSA